MSSIKNYFLFNQFFSLKNNKFLFIILSFQILIIFLSFYWSSFQSYYSHDFTYFEFMHNLNLNKKWYDVIVNNNTIQGVTGHILAPKINFLKSLNYNLNSKFDYFIYLSAFRFLEIFLITTITLSLNKKISLNNFILILVIYILFITNNSVFDSQSYNSLPIIIFCFFHFLTFFFLKNNYLVFIFSLIGNTLSFLLNPMYFFITCFYPLLFIYSFHLYNKNYKNLITIFLTNLPFAILFIFIALGTSRIALSDLYPAAYSNNYNFNIWQNKSYLVLSLLFSVSALSIILKNKNFYALFLIFLTVANITLGALYKFIPDVWMIPQPRYLDYSFKYIFVFLLFKIFCDMEKKKLLYYTVAFTILSLFFFRSYSFVNIYYKIKSDLPKNEMVNFHKDNFFYKKWFWPIHNGEFFLKEDLKNKKILLNLPNFKSDYHRSFSNEKYTNMHTFVHGFSPYSKYFNGSFHFPEFWNNDIITQFSHSQFLDISTVLSNYFEPNVLKIYNTNNKLIYSQPFSGKNPIIRDAVPRLEYNNKLNNFNDIQYILSDIKISENLIKEYKFEEFSLYLYKRNYKQPNLSKINIIKNINKYYEHSKKFDNELYVFPEDFKKVKNILNFCTLKTSNKNKKLTFEIKINKIPCVAIFPIAFSHNNLFKSIAFETNEPVSKYCKTFRVQYFFHACIVNQDINFYLEKNNIFLYPFGSIRDYFDYKKYKWESNIQINKNEFNFE